MSQGEQPAAMRVATINGPLGAALVDRPVPAAQDDLVLVRIDLIPLCTEYKGYRDGRVSEHLGHEAMGTVAEVARPGRTVPGQRVVVMPTFPCGRCALCRAGDYIYCQHGRDIAAETGRNVGRATYAQYLLKPDWLLVPVPEGVSDAHAAMACCGLGPTFGAMQALAVDAFDTVLITGMGPVGLGGVINALYRGARVVAIESHPYRRRLAAELGAQVTLDPTDEATLPAIIALTGGRGVDKAIDCSGAPAAQRLLIDAVRRRGQVAFVGEGGALEVQVSNDFIRKGLTVRGSWHWNLADAPRLWQVIRASGAKIDQLITHTFALTEVREAWDLQLTGNCGKVVLRPWT